MVLLTFDPSQSNQAAFGAAVPPKGSMPPEGNISKPPAVDPSCTRRFSVFSSTLSSPAAPVNELFSAVVPLRSCNAVAIYFSL